MSPKIMLVLDSPEDQEFLEKVLERLKYTVISLGRGKDLSEQLIDHFPDVVFASTLGRNAKILSALGKIKEVRGKPKLVFVKQKNEKHTLSPAQRDIIDGTLYTPVDPFKLIDLLASTTDIDIIELRRRYNEMLARDRGKIGAKGLSGEESSAQDNFELGQGDGSEKKTADYGQTQVFGRDKKAHDTRVDDVEEKQSRDVELDDDLDEHKHRNRGGVELTTKPATTHAVPPSAEEASQKSKKVQQSSSLIYDEERKKRYKEWTDRMNASGEKPNAIDVQELRKRQMEQAQQIKENPKIKNNRKHFLKTLFSIDPKSTTKKQES